MRTHDALDSDPIQTLARERERLKGEHFAGLSGGALVRALSGAVDEAVTALWSEIAGDSAGLSLVALGGYGRGELSPHSDLDLMVLHGGGGAGPDAARTLFYRLWDAGLVVGHAVRSVKDCIALAREKFEAETAFLDARLLAGDPALYETFTTAVWRQTRKRRGAFLGHVRAALDARHTREGRASAMLEPNLKEGSGGLRDLGALAWLGRVFETELVDDREELDLGAAAELLHRVRNHLHYLAGRRQDVVLLQLQGSAAAELGWSDVDGWSAWDAFMRDVYRATRAVEHALGLGLTQLAARPKRRARAEELPDPGLAITDGRVTLDEGVSFATRPELPAALFAATSERKLPAAPEAVRRLRDDLAGHPEPIRWTDDVRSAFFRLLGGGDVHALETFDHIGAMIRYLPEWESVRFRPQHNVYHRYTVDVHAYQTTANLSRADVGDAEPILAEILADLRDRDLLLLTALLHDLGKGSPGDHSQAGERLARGVAARIGIDASRTEELAWLVRNHLLLVDAAVRRDTSDADFVVELAAQVGDAERLRMLYALTVADGLGTGPTAWTRWKSTLLAELFTKLVRILEAGEEASPDARELVRERIAEFRTAVAEHPTDVVDRHVTAMPRAYFYAFPTSALIRHFTLMAEHLPAGEIRAHVEATDELGMHELTLVASDKPGLFSTVSGALALNGLNVVSAQVFTRGDGAALEVFNVTGALDPVVDRARWERVFADVRAWIRGELPIEDRLDEKRRAYVSRRPKSRFREPQVIVDNAASDFYTVVEVHATDRIGLLYAITRTMADLELDIHLAKIATYGEEVVDAFYVRDLVGQKVIEGGALAELERRLLASVSEG